MVDDESEAETMNVPVLTPEQTRQLTKVLAVYSVWVIASAFAYYYFLPDEWKWVAYGPAAFLLLAFGITGIIITAQIFMPNIVPKPIECVYIKGKRVTCCQYCLMAEVKYNIVNNKFPVVKCRETAKVCYYPMKISGWCPYAK